MAVARQLRAAVRTSEQSFRNSTRTSVLNPALILQLEAIHKYWFCWFACFWWGGLAENRKS